MNTATVDIQTTLDRLRTIEKKKDDLVTRVEKFFKARDESPEPDPEKVVPMKPTQLQNLLRLALATSSIQEILLFIRYQEGRHGEWRDRGFGQTLREKIREVEEEASSDEVKIALVRLFIGYLVREARFRRRD